VRSIAEIVPFTKNARYHPESQIRKIKSAVKAYGFTNPLLIDEKNRLLAGHGRLVAARELHMTEVPCIVVSGLTDAQKQGLMISDNRLAEEATWDNDLLLEALGELSTEGFDLELTGFDSFQIENMLSPMPTLDGDERKEADKDGKPSAPSIIVSVSDPIDIPSVAAILRKAVKTAGYRNVKIKEQT
jgi:ParB-like chromosome segregation protein Spo0J